MCECVYASVCVCVCVRMCVYICVCVLPFHTVGRQCVHALCVEK